MPNREAVGEGHDTVLVLSTAGAKVARFVDVFIYVYILLIFAYILTTWLPGGYSPALSRIRQFLHDTCDPYLRLFRRFIPPLGPLDVSPIIAIVVLVVIKQLIDRFL